MTDREALAAALGDWTTDSPPHWQVKATVLAAARRQLPLTPETCGTCEGTGQEFVGPEWTANCPTCHGRGTVYKAETVALVMSAGITLEKAVAVLDALNTEPL